VKPLEAFRRARPPRALYADLDGTLLGPGGSLFAAIPGGATGNAARAIVALRESGVDLVLVSGRTREQMREAARILWASAYVAELGAFLVERGPIDEVVPSLGAFPGPGPAFDAMVRSGAGAFLLERFAGRLEPHTPWAFEGREATMLFRGLVDVREADAGLRRARYGWLGLVDNGRIRRRFGSLDLPEVRAYHLVPRGVGKAAAVRLHRERHGLDPEDTAAVGDSPSDLEVAAEVGALFVVANGVETVGRAADGVDNAYATPSAGGDGVAEAVAALLGPGRA
jgi:hydroxymethylpyrimidine pyrophosphatase-like HAD family hydrolase